MGSLGKHMCFILPSGPLMIFQHFFSQLCGKLFTGNLKELQEPWGQSLEIKEQSSCSVLVEVPLPMPSLAWEHSLSPALPVPAQKQCLSDEREKKGSFPSHFPYSEGRAQRGQALLSPQERGLLELDSWQIGAPTTDESVPYTRVSFKIKISCKSEHTYSKQ